MSTIKTFKAVVNGKTVSVDQVHGGTNRQDIRYRIDGALIGSNEFWNRKPKLIGA